MRDREFLDELILALLSSGAYHDEVATERGTNTYLSDKLLERHISMILEVRKNIT